MTLAHGGHYTTIGQIIAAVAIVALALTVWIRERRRGGAAEDEPG